MALPTREQIEAARARIALAVQSAENRRSNLTFTQAGLADLRVLLAATAEPPPASDPFRITIAPPAAAPALTPEEGRRIWTELYGPGAPYGPPAEPTDEELAQEASDNVDHAAEARAYIRGARREGRR